MSEDIAAQVALYDIESYLTDQHGQPLLTETGEPLIMGDAEPATLELSLLVYQE